MRYQLDPILYINYSCGKLYDSDGFMQGIKDRTRIEKKEWPLIKELDTKIYQIILPPNINAKAFKQNINKAEKISKNTRKVLAPKTFRLMDYYYFSFFQKKLFSYSIFKSIQLILRAKGKSVKNSPILVYDAAKEINKDIIIELSERCGYLILLSNDMAKTRRIQEYSSREFGISPIVTNDFNYAFDEADFIITSENIELPKNKYKWYINNFFIPKNNEYCVNDVTFSVPWDIKLNMSTELLGSILCQMPEKNIEASLKNNGVSLDKIMFNNTIIK